MENKMTAKDNLKNIYEAAIEAAKDCAKALGYHCLILSSAIEGDTRDAAAWHAQIALEVLSSSNPIPVPVCIISGGETTVQVRREGKCS